MRVFACRDNVYAGGWPVSRDSGYVLKGLVGNYLDRFSPYGEFPTLASSGVCFFIGTSDEGWYIEGGFFGNGLYFWGYVKL